MNERQWNEGMNNIAPELVEEHIEEHKNYRIKNSRRNRGLWLGAIAACLCLIVATAVIISGLGELPSTPTTSGGPNIDYTTEGSRGDDMPTPSQGLVFSLTSSGESYAVSGIGTCEDTDIVIPDSYEGLPVTAISENAFEDYTSITSVVIPEGVTTIEKYAFVGCRKLKTVVLPEGLTTIEQSAFLWCTGLTEINFPNTLTRISSSAFRGCESLTSIALPDSLELIGSGAFSDCTNLVEITISDNTVTIYGGIISGTVYYNDDSNWENGVLYLGNHLLEAKTDLSGEYTVREGTRSIADGAFCECENLTAVYIPEGVVRLGGTAFFWCTALAEVTLPEGLKEIDIRTFTDCTSLTHITIPDSVETVGEDAFSGCYSLVSVTFGGNLTSLGDEVFNSCTELTDIYFGGTMAQWEAVEKADTWGSWDDWLDSYTVHCSDGDITKD